MNTLEAQQRVAAAITARGYDADWTPDELAARQLAKMQEEIGELAECFRGMPTWFRVAQEDAAAEARNAFDKPRYWDFALLSDPNKARRELADVQVTVFKLAAILGFDVSEAAVEKATADIVRGVRAAQEA